MINAEVLTFREFAMHESLTLSTIQEAVLQFLQGRNDAVLLGAQAVNAYVSEPRMTQDIDLLSTRAGELAEELREYLNQKFHIAVRIREIADGKGFRIYQVRNEGNRRLVDLRSIDELPTTQTIEDLLILSPAELVASKVISYHSRRGKPKAGTDWRDLAMLLLKFPELKAEKGEVYNVLTKSNVNKTILKMWQEITEQEIVPEGEDEDLSF